MSYPKIKTVTLECGELKPIVKVSAQFEFAGELFVVHRPIWIDDDEYAPYTEFWKVTHYKTGIGVPDIRRVTIQEAIINARDILSKHQDELKSEVSIHPVINSLGE